MNNKIFTTLILFFLFVPIAEAKYFTCYDETTKLVTRNVEGDCFKLGICSGYNFTGMLPNCFFSTEQEYIEAKQSHKKINILAATGSRVIDWTRAEIDAEALAIQTAQDQAKTTSVNNMDISVKEVFTSFLKLYNTKVPAQYRITASELKQQVKNDLGL